MTLFDGKDVAMDQPREKKQSDQILVGAGSVPCTLNFRFENKFSWVTEVSYKIRVIPPSKELILTGRRRRATACMQVLDNDISQMEERLNSAYSQRSRLQNSIKALTQQVELVERNLQEIKEIELKIIMEEGNKRPTASSNRLQF